MKDMFRVVAAIVLTSIGLASTALADEAPRWPVSGTVTEVTDGYLDHRGTDIATPTWTSRSVFACASGRVVYRTPDGQPSATAGNFVVIDHGGGRKSRYLHLKAWSITVTTGQVVSSQTAIGVEGNTGSVQPINGGDGTHLHFEFFYDSNGNDRPDAGEYTASPAGIKGQWVNQGSVIPNFPSVQGVLGTTSVSYGYAWFGSWGTPNVAFFWSAASGATAYDLELSYLPGWYSSWSTLGTFNWMGTSVSFGPLPMRGTYYRLRVRPKSANATGTWSNYFYVYLM